MDKKGKLIVIDGSDGVGKATQTKLLVARLKKEKIPTETLDFPQYQNNLFGKLLGECLAGKYGDFIALDAHIASVLYAADRFESKAKIEKWLAAGKVVVLDRYVSANQMHQGGKIKDAKKRTEFLVWLDKMEHGVFGLPRPDMILCLNLPIALSLQLLKTKKKDLAEKNERYLLNAGQEALKLIQKNNAWKKIDCSDKEGVLSREVIRERVYAEVQKLLKR
ncbi:MAG: hypothetical protein WCI89_00305 [bacterium]